MAIYINKKLVAGGGGSIAGTAGDGLSKEGDTLNVDTPVRGVYTQEEFNALPEEQRNKGLYVIPGTGGGSSGGGSSSGEVYSTEETRIGTWIDGKPLYRRVVTGRITETLKEFQIGDPIPDIETVTSITATYHSGGVVWYPTCFITPPAGGSATTYAKIDMGGEVKVLTSLSNVLNNDIFVTAEYTKTTDQPEVST